MARNRFQRTVPDSHKDVSWGRFFLKHGQYFDVYVFKNLWWILDGVTIGYGDLRKTDIEFVATQLKPGEVFLGYNEHHATNWQQTMHPMVKIMFGSIEYPHRAASKI